MIAATQIMQISVEWVHSHRHLTLSKIMPLPPCISAKTLIPKFAIHLFSSKMYKWIKGRLKYQSLNAVNVKTHFALIALQVKPKVQDSSLLATNVKKLISTLIQMELAQVNLINFNKLRMSRSTRSSRLKCLLRLWVLFSRIMRCLFQRFPTKQWCLF